MLLRGTKQESKGALKAQTFPGSPAGKQGIRQAYGASDGTPRTVLLPPAGDEPRANTDHPRGGKKEERLGSLCGTFKAWSPVTDGPLDLKQFLRAQILPRPPLQSERVSEPRMGPPPPSVYTAGNYCTRAELLHLNLLGRLSW